MAIPSTPKFKSWIKTCEFAFITKNENGEYPIYTVKEIAMFANIPHQMVSYLFDMFNCEAWPAFSGRWPNGAKFVKVTEDSFQVQIS